jgi:hypothetical protein
MRKGGLLAMENSSTLRYAFMYNFQWEFALQIANTPLPTPIPTHTAHRVSMPILREEKHSISHFH